MDLSSLEIFCAVAAEQNVTRAAQRLSRVQSNVTTRVKQLEEELKVQLLSRDGHDGRILQRVYLSLRAGTVAKRRGRGKRQTLESNGAGVVPFGSRLRCRGGLLCLVPKVDIESATHADGRADAANHDDQ
jgi:hypothetical protein